MDFEKTLTPMALNKERTFALATFLMECEKQNVKIKEIISVYNGFQVLFENLDGDAILHDGSYGRGMCMWETYKFPWDDGDVSVHTAEELAEMIGALQKNL